MIPFFVKNRKGDTFQNELTRMVRGSVLAPAQSQIPIVTAAASGANSPGLSSGIIVEGSEDGPSEVFSLVGVNGYTDNADVISNLQVQITDTSWRRRLMNQPVPCTHVFGTAQQPLFLPESMWLEAQQTMMYQFYNNSLAGSSNFEFQMERRKYLTTALANPYVGRYISDQRVRKRQMYPYWLTSDNPILLAANSSQTVTFTVDESLSFLGIFLMGTYVLDPVSPATAGDLQEVFTLQFFDGQTQRPLQNQPVSFNNACGNAKFPYRLPAPWLLPQNSLVTCTIQSLLTNGAPTKVYLSLFGVGCYALGLPPLIGSNADLKQESVVGGRY